MRKRIHTLKPYFAVAGLYLLFLTLLKVVEFFLLGIDASNRFQLLLNAVVYNLVVASWTVLAAGFLYWLVSLLSRRVAVVLAAVFYAFLILSEVGLLFYSFHNGYLLGCELVARPLSESWMAVRGAVGVVLPLVLPLLLVGGFVALALWRAKKPTKAVWAVPVVTLIFALLSLCFKTSHLVPVNYSYFILNKTHYLCVDSYKYFRLSGRPVLAADGIPLEYDEALVADLLATHPEWGTPLDPAYPLERPFVPDSFLNPYLRDISPAYHTPSPLRGTPPVLGGELAPSSTATPSNPTSTPTKTASASSQESTAPANSSPKLGEVAQRAGGVCQPQRAGGVCQPQRAGGVCPTPNIIIILVESLGHEFMGTGAMPFVDSLAATGLYWSNCLSATTRSYGAIPALTGSVGGPKSFQFGTMPAHNSLFSLLREAGYTTRSYYSGDYTFDCIYEYLTAQRVDSLVTSYGDYRALPASQRPNWWGYNDDTLFARALRDLNSQLSTLNSQLSLITTLSMHDPLSLPDKARQQAYERRAQRLPLFKTSPDLARFFPACLFTDDCLRSFFRDYSRRPDFQNTLFVITGDHACGSQRGDKLSYHHVPLILWSPLVKAPARFDHLVTHNDVAPALYSLLTSKYGVPAQPTVHWLGDGLGPTPKTLLVVNYMHEITDVVYHNCYYQSESHFAPEVLYTIGPDMQLHPCGDAGVLDACRRQLRLMKYLYAYTYYKDRLTAHPLYTRSYTTARVFRLPALVEYVNPDSPPSSAGCVDFQILPAMHLVGTQGYTSVRVTVEADVTVRDTLGMNQFPDLCITFDGCQSVCERDRLVKFLSGDAERTPGTYRLSLAKEFILSPSCSENLSVYLSTPWTDDDWVPSARITLANTIITIDYGR